MKLIGIGMYFFGSYFFDSFIIKEISILSVSASDYWFSKNVSGKRLTGLFWCWFFIDQNVFLCYWNYSEFSKVNRLNRLIFWLSFYISGAIWIFVFIMNFLTLSVFDLIISLFPAILILNNLINYTKCVSEKHSLIEKLKENVEKLAKNKIEFKLN